MLHKGFEDMSWTTLPSMNCMALFRLKECKWDLVSYHRTSLSRKMMSFFHHSHMIRPLSFSICSLSHWLLAVVWYLLRHVNGTYFLSSNVWVLSGRFPGYSVPTLLSSQNWTRTIGQDIVAGDNKIQPSNAIALSVKQQVFLTVWVGLAADSLAVELLDWHSFQSFWLLGHPL